MFKSWLILGIILVFFFAAPPRYEVCIARHMHVTPLYFLSYRTGKGLFARKVRCSTNVYMQRSVIELDNHLKSSFLAPLLRSFHWLEKHRALVSFVSVVLQTTPT